MATTDIPVLTTPEDSDRPSRDHRRGTASRGVVRTLLAPLASLRLTVVLLAMAVFIVLVGTLAQAEMGIERVVNEFFRVRPWGPTLGFAWVPFQVFFPEAFFPNPLANARPTVPYGFWFPGGWLIGLVMFVNLLAAHALRFTAQAKGSRLLGGLALIALGVLVTAGVVASGSTAAGGLQAAPLLSWSLLWKLFQANVVLLSLANVGAAIRAHVRSNGDRRAAWLLTAATPITVGLAVWALLVPDVGESSMRILWQLIKGTFAALVLLAGCWVVFRKRAGIVLLHAGVGLLMISELLVGLLAVETNLTLREGQTKSWAEDIRDVELVVTDPSNPDYDTVTRFPSSLLRAGSTLAHDSIPLTLRVDRYYANSDVGAAGAKENPADSGLGRRVSAVETKENPGTSAAIDFPSAYVTVAEAGGKALGTYLLTTFRTSDLTRDEFQRKFGAVDPDETIRVGDKEYRLALRFKRDYKPYAVTLLDVRKDDYVGTDVPRNYSSDIRVASKQLGADFEKRVWMNNPLRFAGETIYQSEYLFPRGGAGEGTRLQVVKNTGWMLPYVACMIVVVGMAAQFLVTLSRFVGRRAEAAAIIPAGSIGRQPRAGRLAWIVPAAVALIFAGWLGSKLMPPRLKSGQPDIAAFGKIPVVANGRYKPIDTVARDALKALSDNRQEYKTGRMYGPWDMFAEKKPASQWLLDYIASPQKGAAHKVVRIDNTELATVLGLPTDRSDFLYSIVEVVQAMPKLQQRLTEIDKARKEGKVPTAADRAAIKLQGKIGTIDLIHRCFVMPPLEDLLKGGVGGLRDYIDDYDVLKHGDPGNDVKSRNPVLAVYYSSPPTLAARNGGKASDWETLSYAQVMEALKQFAASHEGNRHELDPGVAAWTEILDAWNKGDVAAFNAEVTKYRAALAAKPPEGYQPARVRFEGYFNEVAPFYWPMYAYVVAGLLGACSWLGASRLLNRTAFWLVVLAFAFHTLALAGRIYISGRPPVTNLYSSAVFVGWGAVAFGIGLERMYRLGFGNVLAGITGFAGLLIAHSLSKDGEDTFSVLQAVLDTQFWLATHVVTINMGYAAVAAAGCLGLLYIVLGLATPLLGERVGTGPRAQTVGDALTRMTYGTLCFAMLFSFFGTVLGGLWADDSWGRFWGWDPKENGALIIVLWTALVLHARWAGIVKDRGLAALAVGGNIAVSWSWFGTNQLGVGLHAYGGFAGTVVFALAIFILTQLLTIAAACLPKALWVSFHRPATA